ncbi:MAG: glycoside hydrolase family 88 protein [Sphingobacteriia bacterium]|nr:glycoside hydrolase family 88 protein [Sphingobacteriia bacterium]
MRKNTALLLIASVIFFGSVKAQYTYSANSVKQVMKKVADWQLNTWAEKGMKAAKWDWTNATAYAGFMAFDKIANDSTYCKAMYAIGEALQWNTGPRRMMADDYCIAQTYIQLYAKYHEPLMIEKFKLQADSICSMPHTESLEWKNDVRLREWAWCDALFMAPPALAYLTTVTKNPKYLDTACSLWWKTTDYLFDKEEDLYFRDSKYFDMREANGKKVFWSRGNGWVMAGLVRLLEAMPPKHTQREKFIRLYREMAERIAGLQHQDGTWHSALLDSVSYPLKETSGTGFYCYALAWGINHHIIPYKKYAKVVWKAWDALTNCVHSNGQLGFVQKIGEKPGVTDDSNTETFGVGAFLLAGSEIITLSSLKQ